MKPRCLWRNANILTLDSELPLAEAMVTQGESLLFVGSLSEAEQIAGSASPSIDLEGRTVAPGFNDNHLHLVFHGDHAIAPDLAGLSESQIVDRMQEHAKTQSKNALLVGFGWEAPACARPRKELLDEAFPNRPIALPGFGGHALWVNSVVLRSLGIDRDHSPETGLVERDENGEPTGVLKEMASGSPVSRHFREIFFKKSLREAAISRALNEYAKVGITSVQDNSWFHPVVHTLAKWRREGTLSARVSCWSFGREPKTWSAMERAPFDKLWVRKGPQKFFLDGTFTDRTAWMIEPYPGTVNNCGMSFDPQWLKSVLTRLVSQKRQGAFHSIGDESTKTFLDVWETVVQRHPEGRFLRMRLEHGQVIRPEDRPRLAPLGVCIAAQPPALVNPEKDREILGPERAQKCYSYRSLLDAGVALSFGSDIPGESFFEPLRGISLVCNRNDSERLEPEQALRAYTQGSAYVEFEEHRKGTLKTGYLADFTVLSDNPLTVDRARLRDIQVERTVVGGRTVWQNRP